MAKPNSVSAVFDGANQSDKVLESLRGAGFGAEQVSATVAGGHADGDDGAGAVSLPTILGVVLGALLGGLLGYVILDGNLPIILGAIVGAVAGAAIAPLAARSIAASQPLPTVGGLRTGSVTLTVRATNEGQAREARTLFERHGGRVRGA